MYTNKIIILEKSTENSVTVKVSTQWEYIQEYWYFCSSVLRNLLITHESWSRYLERKHTQDHRHDKGWLFYCCRRCKSITDYTELLLMYSRTATKKTTVQSTPSSASQRSYRTNTSLHAFQFAAFAICSPVIHPPSFMFQFFVTAILSAVIHFIRTI